VIPLALVTAKPYALVRQRPQVSRFLYYPANATVDPLYTRYRYGHGTIQDELVNLGELDLSFKKFFKSVRKVGRVVLRVIPGAIGGFIVGGPVGAVVGAAAGYESARRAGGKGIHLKGTQLFKSVGYGAAAGVATTAVSGAVAKVVPTFAAKIGIASPLATTTGAYTTGLVSPISSAAFTAGGSAGALLKTAGTLLAAQRAVTRPQVATETELPVGPADYTTAPSSQDLAWLKQAGAASIPAAPWSIPSVASEEGSQYFTPSVLPGSSGGFATPETIEGGVTPGIGGIPWNYIILGVAGMGIIYLVTRRPAVRYARNPRRRRRIRR